MDLFPFIVIIGVCVAHFTSSANATCQKNGQTFDQGTFQDPADPCKECTCKSDGTFTCALKTCPTPKCGELLHRPTSDGCCQECSKICEGASCPILSCPLKDHFYQPDQCCPECGCIYDRRLQGQGPVGHPCENCICHSNGSVICNRLQCPDARLECLDPDFDENCNYVCPQEKTCKQGEVVIKYGEFKIVGKKVCTCVGDWYPRAFCNQKMSIDVMKQLMNRMCVADARNYDAWKQIEELYKPPQLTPPPLL